MIIKARHTIAMALTACLTFSSMPAISSMAEEVNTPTSVTEVAAPILPEETYMLYSTVAPSITVNKIKFEVVNDKNLPAAVKGQLGKLKLKRGYRAFPYKGGFLLFVGSGEKTSGGYGIQVLSIEDNEGWTNVQVRETSPKPDDMTTSVVTYPYVVVKMTGVTDRFNIKNEAGVAFTSLTPAAVQSTVNRSIASYVGRIDSNSIEVTVAGKPIAIQLGRYKKAVDGMKLKKGANITVSWKTNANGQNLLVFLMN